MGNVVGKSKGMGYYGASREGFCYEDNTEGFVIVKASLVPSPENTYEVEEEQSTGRRSPFEQVTSGETTEIAERKDLEDSGYAEAQAAAHRCRGASPEPIPVPSDQHEHHEVIQVRFKSLWCICLVNVIVATCYSYMAF